MLCEGMVDDPPGSVTSILEASQEGTRKVRVDPRDGSTCLPLARGFPHNPTGSQDAKQTEVFLASPRCMGEEALSLLAP